MGIFPRPALQTAKHNDRQERVRCTERVTWKVTSPCVKQRVNGNLLYVSGNLTGALCQPRGVGWGGRWEGGSKGRGYMYAYG